MKKVVAICAAAVTGAIGLGLAFSLMPLSASETPPATPVTLATPASASAPMASHASLPALPSPAVTAAMFQPAPAPAAAPPALAQPVAAQASPVAEEPATPGKRLPAYTYLDVDAPYVALTFDDGPNPETTPKLLKMLADRHVKATFFMLGNRAVQAPEVVKAVAAAGHEIGNHSWSHPQLTKLPVAAADKQVEDTSALLEQITGTKPVLMRPPYGSMSPSLQAHLYEKFGITQIFWSVDPLDWKIRDPQSVYDQIMKQVRPGAIILAHDIHPTTVAAMPRVIDALIAKGYKIVTVSELIAHGRPPAPKVVAQAEPQVKKKPKPAHSPAAPAAAPKPIQASAPGAPMSITPAVAAPTVTGSITRN
ncbi:polysaccharide deacetylase family protein [Aquabacter sp. P-9]|uniref:polysaccharide deacetylase family protein n=1 Tax=Aquabacter sediminis TaxID=3029197 RepID=UPI00237DC7DA|nr:polysaccharide deacetylase family protein [Aquabacter sp. P-9]MDE1570103.1 polysaccharide deacetylase family protein [Aquabacter sp. P-9]